MEGEQRSQILQILRDAVEGDVGALEALSKHDHATLQEYAAQAGELILRPAAARRVLIALEQNKVSPGLVQEWASFMRRGYISDRYLSTTGSQPLPQPIRAIDIKYESSAEDQIAEVISRLDEIGDLIDGMLTRREIETMLHELP